MATEETLLELHKASNAISAIKYLPYQWNVVKQRFDISPPSRVRRWHIFFTIAKIYIATKIVTFLLQIPKTPEGRVDVAKLMREFIAVFGILAIAMVYLINAYFYHQQWATTLNMLLNLNKRLKIRSKSQQKDEKMSKLIYDLLNKGWPILFVASAVSTFYNMPENIVFDMCGQNMVFKVLFWMFELQFLHSIVFLLRFQVITLMVELNCFKNWLTTLKKNLVTRKGEKLLAKIPKYRQIYKIVLLLHCRIMQSISHFAVIGIFFLCSIILLMSCFIVVRFHKNSSLSRLIMPIVLIFLTIITFPVAISKAYIATKMSNTILYKFKINADTPQDRYIARSLFPIKSYVGSFFAISRGTTLNLFQWIFKYIVKFLLWFK